ncbi:methyl-accepting chemotaxis protein [Erythrobacter oryzae]|uniref:methyl-accepting chemotaxis protein n=1 Tax=Erythrobacter oryzae TaxID=3019556 RepID=UPI0025535ED4|nr:methyl-accepting chemotaxis protein [Erythrobacter sp. COR-2]
MVFARPLHPRRWLAGALLLAAALAGAAVEGAWASAALICAAAAAFVLAQRPRPAPPPFIGPMKRRASDFLGFGGVTILGPADLPEPLREDIEATLPFLDTLRGQIDGVQQDVAQGVMAVVEQVEVVSRLSTGQRERIAHSLSGVSTMRAAVAVPGTIIARLSAMLAERDRMIAGNYQGLEQLAQEFHELRGAVDVISQVADKAFFLAVNASVEAHRHGEAGKAFGLIATEMRALATQTAEGARNVGQRINSFADRMQAQISAAMPGRNDAGTQEVARLMGELDAAQAEIAAISARLGELIAIMEAGHGDLVHSLSDILGRLQFEDVMRQRLGQVGDALGDLRALAAEAADGVDGRRSVRDLLEDQQRSYVMESQKVVHAVFGGGGEAPADMAAEAPVRRIELF